ncbi:MAG: protein phosphatase 2C domain-containing protein [Rhizomicrobium sp.]
MPFEILDTLSLPGDPLKPNDDAFGHAGNAAVVIDGATSLGEPLMPGDSDAAWLAHFGARRLMAHVRDGDAPLDALRDTLADAKKSFEALRKREPAEQWEIPFASMAFVQDAPGGFDFLWFGDCAALIARPDAAVEVLGESFAAKAREAEHVRKARQGKRPSRPRPAPAGPNTCRRCARARSRVNSGKYWAFSPDPRAADFVGSFARRGRRAAPICCSPATASSRSPPITAATPRPR